jgi:hypothetical protein
MSLASEDEDPFLGLVLGFFSASWKLIKVLSVMIVAAFLFFWADKEEEDKCDT